MICEKLDQLDREFSVARNNDRHRGVIGESEQVRQARKAIIDHKCSGHDGEPCPGD